MPFAMIIVGLVLLISAVRNNVTTGTPNLVTLVKGDFTGTGSFIYWGVAIGAFGAVGYAPKLKGFSDVLLLLVMTGLLFSNSGFFAKLTSQLSAGSTNTSLSSTSNSTTAPLFPNLPNLSSLGGF